MSAGQLGGQLYPTDEINIIPPLKKGGEGGFTDSIKRNREINLSFGHAIQEWNKHNYKEAVKMFKNHVEEFPDSPWAAEAVLHTGCDATYNGRYTEAEESFNWILEKNKGKDHEGSKIMINKARTRLAILKVYQNNFKEAQRLFAELKKEGSDWRDRTYASHWLQRLSRYSSNQLAMLNCGTQALAYLLEKDGKKAEARKVIEMLPESLQGHSIKDLSNIVLQYGYNLTAVKISPSELDNLPLPAIMHVNRKNEGDNGHYWILERAVSGNLKLFDPQSGMRFNQSVEEFTKEWSGNALVFLNDKTLPGIRLTGSEMEQIYGGCCGVARPEESLGAPGEYAGGPPSDQCSEGAPVWSVNMINMNLFMTDTPMWYTPPIGPSVKIQLSYNSQSAIAQYEPFGNKWTFNYGSYLVVDTGGNVTVFMPDGRRDIYSPDGQGGYTKPFGVFNTLTKIAENHFELAFLDGTVYVYNIPFGTSSLQPFLVEIKDAYNQKLTFGYNSSVQIETITDALNRVTSLVDSDSDGLIDQINDPFGRSAYFVYTNGNLTKITDMGGYWTELSYDADVYLTKVENSKGFWDFYIEPADGISLSESYPPPGGIMWENYRITVTDPIGKSEEYYFYGDSGNHSWHVSKNNYVPYTASVNNGTSTLKTYYYNNLVDQNGRLAQIISSEGGELIYNDYDSVAGKPRNISDYHGNINGSPVRHYTQLSYNANGLISSYIDAKGNVSTFEYYQNDIDVWKIRHNLQSTPEDDNIILNTFTYNGNTHDITTTTDRLGNVTEFTYNSYGQLISITEAKGSSIESITELVYDPTTHNLSEIKKAGSLVTSLTYDNIGRVKTKTDAAGLTLTYDYNDLNQLTKITYPDTKFETFTYSTCCPRLIDSITDRAGLTANYTYDALKQLTKVQSPQGVIRYEYDANGNLTKLIDADGKETSFEFDLDNRLKKKIYADGKLVTYTYDPAGLLTKFTNSRNIEKNYTYDASHNLLSIHYSDATPDVSFAYDDYDRQIIMVDGTGLYQYSYDDNNRLTSVAGPLVDDTITYQYNELSQLKTLAPQLGQAINYSYDPLGRLTAIQLGTNTFTYGYTGVNPLIQTLTRPNGSMTEYLYNDPLKRLTEITNKTSADIIINKHVFMYNNLDLIGSETITTGTALDSFTAGVKTYNYNNLNQLLDSTNPNQLFTYDDDGNMTQGYTPNGYEMTMTYDAENRMTSAQYTDSGSVVHRTEYFYSGDSILAQVKKFENGVMVSDTSFVVVGFLPVQDRDASNAITREYTWGLNMGGGIGGLLNLKQSGADYSYLYDGKGNVSALIDSSQNVVASYRYDVFGKLLKKTGTLDQPYRFSTKQYDEQPGHYNFGYRFYSHSVGRWMTRDPLGESGGINLYQFVGNDPVNTIDPWGLFGKDVHYDLTYKLALEAGFLQEQARLIASANQGLDEGLSNPFNPFGGTQLHFMSPQDARKVCEKAVENTQNLTHLGQGLHMLQDSYSHYTQGYRWYTGGHLKDGHTPDISYTSTNTQKMTEETLKYLRQFRKKISLN